jgi:uncharacterized membrane protein
LERPRLQSIDALRGLVMIIMAIDHTRDFFHIGAMTGSPTDLATTTPPLFFTRWITHICAPTFMLLAGAAARLWLSKPGRTTAQLSRFLFTRGLWLIVAEVILMRLAFDFTFGLGAPILLITLFALGASMIVLAALVHVPVRMLAPFAALVIVGHNALDGVRAEQLGGLSWLWTVLHQPGILRLGGPIIAVDGYPLIPWFAVMALGYCLGQLILNAPDTWRRTVGRIGVGCIVAFVLLRALNVYGDPAPWSAQSTAAMTAVSFLNATKQPPSLLFLLMTLGPALALLPWLAGKKFADANPLLVFGRVPLFYFLGHFFVLHAMMIVASMLRYGANAFSFAIHAAPSMGGAAEAFPKNFGYDLPAVYLAWVVVLVLMYPLCRWFGALRARRTDWWLSYL